LWSIGSALLQAQQRDEEHTEVVSEHAWLDRFLKTPSVVVLAGAGALGREGLVQQLRAPGVVSLHLGTAELAPKRRVGRLVEYSRHAVALSMGSSALGLGRGTEGLAQRWWQFGLISEGGYGYRLGQTSSLLLTHGGGMCWTVFGLQDTVPEALAAFHERLRFGTQRSGALVLQFSPLMGVGICVERAAVFPAHLVWKHLGSALLEGAGHVLIEQFVERILRARTPAAAPVVSFVLHNGFAYGWYELLRRRMNWPFASPAPLRMDAVRLQLQWLF